jgi:hypothetical protein
MDIIFHLAGLMGVALLFGNLALTGLAKKSDIENSTTHEKSE